MKIATLFGSSRPRRHVGLLDRDERFMLEKMAVMLESKTSRTRSITTEEIVRDTEMSEKEVTPLILHLVEIGFVAQISDAEWGLTDQAYRFVHR